MPATTLACRSIDEAWIYQNETEVGRAIEEKIKEGVVKREDVWITRYIWVGAVG